MIPSAASEAELREQLGEVDLSYKAEKGHFFSLPAVIN